MKRFIYLCLTLLCINGSFAQEIMKYDWGAPLFEKTESTEADTASAYIFKSIRTIEMLYNENNEFEAYQLVHEKVKINNNRALDAYNTIRFNLASYNDITELKARFIGKDGKVVELNKSNLKTVENEEEGSYKLLAIEGAEAGGIIEYFWIRKGISNLYGKNIIQDTYPQKEVAFTIISPMNLQFTAKSYNGCPEMTEVMDTVAERRILSLSVLNVPPSEKEIFSYPDKYLQRVEYTLAYNSAKGKQRVYSRSEAARNIFDNTTVFTPDETKTLKTLIKKIKLNSKASEEEKIRQIENFVKMNYQIVDASIPGMNISDISDIVTTNYADKLGAVRLFTALFNQYEIPFEFVLTCDKTKRSFDMSYDGYNFLDERLLYFPGIDKYLDPNSNYNRLDIIDHNYLGNGGMFLKSVQMSGVSSYMPYYKVIPDNDYEKSVHETNVQIKLNDDNSMLEYTTVNIFSGYTADFIQPLLYYGGDEVKINFIEMIMDADKGSNQLISWKVNNQEPIDWFGKPVSVEAQMSGNKYLVQGGDDIIVNIGVLIGKQVEMYQKTERKLPIESDNTRTYKRHIVFDIPNGYSISNPEVLTMKKELLIDGQPNAYFYSDYSIDGNKLTVTSTEAYKRTTYGKEDAEAYIEVINAAADFNKITLVLKPKK